MAWSINKAFVLGNVTRDPEVRYTPNGAAVTSFGVATNRRWKDASGAIQEDTQFHDVVAWGKTAEAVSQILKKGAKVAVIGRLQNRSWDAPDGSKRNKTEIVLEEFVPLTPKTGAGIGSDADHSIENDSQDAPASTRPAASKAAPQPQAEEEINLDDIPF